mmetsp:Transcript_123032/g.359133  ORF Transcript_123032/g.359133 Transcript_123032/m.359133 type:complete len:240 (-) Transcript_123032:216-935(-)
MAGLRMLTSHPHYQMLSNRTFLLLNFSDTQPARKVHRQSLQLCSGISARCPPSPGLHTASWLLCNHLLFRRGTVAAIGLRMALGRAQNALFLGPYTIAAASHAAWSLRSRRSGRPSTLHAPPLRRSCSSRSDSNSPSLRVQTLEVCCSGCGQMWTRKTRLTHEKMRLLGTSTTCTCRSKELVQMVSSQSTLKLMHGVITRSTSLRLVAPHIVFQGDSPLTYACISRVSTSVSGGMSKRI